MLKFINLKRLTAKTLIGILMVGGFIAQSSNKQAVASNGVQGLELNYYDSAFSCGGVQADIKVKVYTPSGRFLTTMSKGDTYSISGYDSVEDLQFRYEFSNYGTWGCSGRRRADRLYRHAAYDTVAYGEALPSGIDTTKAFNGQVSLSEMLNGLENYEELYLVELWSTSRPYYDLQDVVLVVDNDPVSLGGGTNPDGGGGTNPDGGGGTNPDGGGGTNPDGGGGTNPDGGGGTNPDGGGGTNPDGGGGTNPDGGGGTNPDPADPVLNPVSADTDYDKNGIPDSKETDGDYDENGVPDFQDPDDDGDGIPDVMELYSPADIDFSDVNDVTYKVNSDATETTISLPKAPVNNLEPTDALNSYSDTNADYQNIDSDGDNISDKDESGRTSLSSLPINTDKDFTDSDTTPDYLDTDSDNDGLPDSFEAGDTDLDTAPYNSDRSISGDSLADYRDLDSDDNGIIDADEVDGDIDDDNVNNFQDLDDDGDGINDVIEIGSDPAEPTNSDGDNDNEDYQDTDSDNDGIFDSVEGVKDSSEGATSISVTYPNSNGTATTYNLQDSSQSDTKNTGVSCVAEGVANTCAMTSTSVADGKVTITGKMTGLDYQVPNYAD